MSKATYKISKLDNGRYCKTNGHFARHLKANGFTYQEYFEMYETRVTPLCYCCKPLTFYQKSETYANSCGDPKCVGKNVSATKQAWDEEKRAEDSANKKLAAATRTEEQKATQVKKARQTFRKKYGVEWSSKLESQKAKSRSTKLARYGDERYNNREAISEVNLSKSVEEKNAINEKRRRTNLKKYGIENVLMREDIRSKSARSNSIGKEYTLPSGKIIRIRGYENLVLDQLFNAGYLEDQVVADNSNNFRKNNIPSFSYIDVGRHIMKYFPDIYIPAENRIIEVKSEWWWNGYGREKYRSRLINNLRKRQSVIDKGYNYEVWIFSSKTQYRILKNESDFQAELEKLSSINA